MLVVHISLSFETKGKQYNPVLTSCIDSKERGGLCKRVDEKIVNCTSDDIELDKSEKIAKEEKVENFSMFDSKNVSKTTVASENEFKMMPPSMTIDVDLIDENNLNKFVRVDKFEKVNHISDKMIAGSPEKPFSHNDLLQNNNSLITDNIYDNFDIDKYEGEIIKDWSEEFDLETKLEADKYEELSSSPICNDISTTLRPTKTRKRKQQEPLKITVLSRTLSEDIENDSYKKRKSVETELLVDPIFDKPTSVETSEETSENDCQKLCEEKPVVNGTSLDFRIQNRVEKSNQQKTLNKTAKKSLIKKSNGRLISSKEQETNEKRKNNDRENLLPFKLEYHLEENTRNLRNRKIIHQPDYINRCRTPQIPVGNS